MPIYNDPAILGAINQKKKSSDEITRILANETKPTFGDSARAAAQNILATAVGSPIGVRGNMTSAELQAQERAQNMAAPHKDLMTLADQSIKAGSEQAKAIQDSFGMFADNPDDLAALWNAAESDPEEITAQNAATFAAKKAQELGFKSVKKMQAENQQAFGEARLMAAGNKAAKDASGKVGGFDSMYGGVQSAPSEQPVSDTSSLRIIRSNPDETLLPPTVNDGGAQEPFNKLGNAKKEPSTADVNGVIIDKNKFKMAINQSNVFDEAKVLARADEIKNKNKIYADSYNQGKEAEKVLSEVSSARQALNNILSKNQSTGIAQDYIGRVFNNPDFETISKAGSATAILQRVAGTGAVSNFDAAELKNQVMSGARSPEYNMLVLAAMEAGAKNEKDYSEFLDWYVGSFGTMDDAKKVWSEFRKENPMVKQNGKSYIPEYLPGFNADWRKWVGGTNSAPAQSLKDTKDMTQEEIDAEMRALKGN